MGRNGDHPVKLKVLGSSGAEAVGHNLPAFLVDSGLLLDAGTIGLALNESEQWKIRDILITHAHLDHIRGIPFLADNLLMRNKRQTITVTSTAQALRALQKNLLNNVIWPDFTRIPDTKNPVIRFRHIVPGRPFAIKGYSIVAYKVAHSVPAVGYIIEDARGKRLLYSGDTGPTDLLWKAAKRIDYAIIEISLPNTMEERAIMTGHLTPRLLKKEIRKMEHPPRKILITHPKPQYLKKIKKEVEALHMANIAMLEEGKIYEI